MRLVTVALSALLLVALAATAVLGQEDLDYYDVLDLQKEREDASEKDIKKKFRVLSKKYHPDLNPGDEGAREMYQKINRAYEVLSDKRKRKIYDMKGDEGLKQLEKAKQNPNAGMQDPFARMFNMGGGQDNTKGKNQELTVDVPLADVYNGKTHKLTINKQKLCKRCRGTGAASKDAFTKCSHCKGEGTTLQRIQIAPGFVQQVQNPCPHCGGTGKMIKTKCPACRGQKVTRGDSVLEVDIDRGVPEGHKVTFEMEADQSPDLLPGDVIIVIRTKNDATFARKGDDLEATVKITLREALLGFEKTLQHMDGRGVPLSAQSVTPHGKRVKIAGEGMPKFNVPSEKGDLYITYQFELPRFVSKDQREKIEKLF